MSSKGNNLMMVKDESSKKMKRMISNRESARRSRMKKEKHMKDLNDQIFYLSRKKEEAVLKIERIRKGHDAMEMENMVLRSQKQELEKRLEYANTVTICGGHNNINGGVGVVHQEPWLRPWEPSNSNSNSMHVNVNVMSSAGFSHF